MAVTSDPYTEIKPVNVLQSLRINCCGTHDSTVQQHKQRRREEEVSDGCMSTGRKLKQTNLEHVRTDGIIIIFKMKACHTINLKCQNCSIIVAVFAIIGCG